MPRYLLFRLSVGSLLYPRAPLRRLILKRLSISRRAIGLVDTKALVEGLRSGVVSMAGLDVYEKESSYFFRDCSDAPVQVCDGGTARFPEAGAARSTVGRSLRVVMLGVLLGSRSFFSYFFRILSVFVLLFWACGVINSVVSPLVFGFRKLNGCGMKVSAVASPGFPAPLLV